MTNTQTLTALRRLSNAIRLAKLALWRRLHRLIHEHGWTYEKWVEEGRAALNTGMGENENSGPMTPEMA